MINPFRPGSKRAEIFAHLHGKSLSTHVLADLFGITSKNMATLCGELSREGCLRRVNGTGTVSIWTAVPQVATPATGPTTLRDRIMHRLLDGPATSGELATCLDASSRHIAARFIDLQVRGLVKRIDDRAIDGSPATWAHTAAGHSAAIEQQKAFSASRAVQAAPETIPASTWIGAGAKAPVKRQPADKPGDSRDTSADDRRKGTSSLLTALGDQAYPSVPTRDGPRMTSSAIHGLRHAPGDDPRPIAAGRDPCPRCSTRGDLGCKHFRPCEPVEDNFRPRADARCLPPPNISGQPQEAYHG